MGSSHPLRAAGVGALLLLCAVAALDWAGAGEAVGPAPLLAPFAPDLEGIELRDGAGRLRPLAEVLPAEGPALIHVWATWCAPCVAELPEVAAFAAALEAEGRGDRLLLVSVDGGAYERIAVFLRDRLGLDRLESYQDAGGGLGTALRLAGIPGTLVIDGEGRIVARAEGALSWTDPALRARFREGFGFPF